MKWAIHAKRLFDGTGNTVIQDALVVIENQRITAVGPASQGPLPADVPVLEVGDRTVLHGVVSAGLMTRVLPVASAAPIFQIAISSG